MRILMVTPMLPYPETPSAGPLGIYGTLSCLHERHTVTLATFAGPDPAERAAIERMRATGVDVHPVWRERLAGLARWQWRWRLGRGWLRGADPRRALEFAEPAMQQLLDRLLAAGSFDLIQVEDNAMAGYHYPVDIPMVLTEHEVHYLATPVQHSLTPDGLARRLIDSAEWRRWQHYQPVVWRRFNRIQVFTPRDAAALNALAPELAPRVCVNPFAIPLPPAAEPNREEVDTVVFVGGFTHAPNVDAALWLGRQIMPLLWKLRPGARLTIVGDQPPASVRQLAGPGIAVTGRVPAVEPHLERAAVVLAPLRTGGGMRMKVLQAMALGKPVITTTLGAEGLATDGSKPPLVLAEDAHAIAEAAATLLGSRVLRADLGSRARAFIAAHHNLAAYARRLDQIYDELAGGRILAGDYVSLSET